MFLRSIGLFVKILILHSKTDLKVTEAFRKKNLVKAGIFPDYLLLPLYFSAGHADRCQSLKQVSELSHAKCVRCPYA
jgi:hypothetical protein